jgi:hypothetical protein
MTGTKVMLDKLAYYNDQGSDTKLYLEPLHHLLPLT